MEANEATNTIRGRLASSIVGIGLLMPGLPGCANARLPVAETAVVDTRTSITLTNCQRAASKPPAIRFICDLQVRNVPPTARWLLLPDIGYIDEPIPDVVEGTYSIESTSPEPPSDIFAVSVSGSVSGFGAVHLDRAELNWSGFEITTHSHLSTQSVSFVLAEEVVLSNGEALTSITGSREFNPPIEARVVRGSKYTIVVQLPMKRRGE